MVGELNSLSELLSTFLSGKRDATLHFQVTMSCLSRSDHIEMQAAPGMSKFTLVGLTNYT